MTPVLGARSTRMNTSSPTRFPIRFERWYGALSSALLLRPADSWVELSGDEVECRMGWAFRARFPRASVKAARRFAGQPLSRGVHGFAARWLVNGSGQDLVELELEPTQRARVLGVPVRLRQLLVSVEAPDALLARLR